MDTRHNVDDDDTMKARGPARPAVASSPALSPALTLPLRAVAGSHVMPCHGRFAMDVMGVMRCQPTAVHPYEPTAARGHLVQNPGFGALMKDPELGKVETAMLLHRVFLFVFVTIFVLGATIPPLPVAAVRDIFEFAPQSKREEKRCLHFSGA